jgi:hypothetical protein
MISNLEKTAWQTGQLYKPLSSLFASLFVSLSASLVFAFDELFIATHFRRRRLPMQLSIASAAILARSCLEKKKYSEYL